MHHVSKAPSHGVLCNPRSPRPPGRRVPRYPTQQCPHLLQDVLGALRAYHLPEKFLVASIVVRMAPCTGERRGCGGERSQR